MPARAALPALGELAFEGFATIRTRPALVTIAAGGRAAQELDHYAVGIRGERFVKLIGSMMRQPEMVPVAAFARHQFSRSGEVGQALLSVPGDQRAPEVGFGQCRTHVGFNPQVQPTPLLDSHIEVVSTKCLQAILLASGGRVGRWREVMLVFVFSFRHRCFQREDGCFVRRPIVSDYTIEGPENAVARQRSVHAKVVSGFTARRPRGRGR